MHHSKKVKVSISFFGSTEHWPLPYISLIHGIVGMGCIL